MAANRNQSANQFELIREPKKNYRRPEKCARRVLSALVQCVNDRTQEISRVCLCPCVCVSVFVPQFTVTGRVLKHTCANAITIAIAIAIASVRVPWSRSFGLELNQRHVIHVRTSANPIAIAIAIAMRRDEKAETGSKLNESRALLK